MSSLDTINKLELEQARSLSSHLHNLSNEYLEAYGLTHLWITKFYFDGRYLDITNDLSWKEIMMTNNHYNDFVKMCLEPLKPIASKSAFLMWGSHYTLSDELCDKVFQQGIHSKCDIITIHEDHIEIYGFGSSKSPLEFYAGLPSLTELEMFCLHLREGIFHDNTQQNLVLGNIGCSFIPPQPFKGYSMVPVPNSFSLSCDGRKAKLSRRELVCLGLLASGYSQKEAAQIMNISPRTIESHFNNIKNKLNNPSKIQLITSFNRSSLGGVDPFLLLE